MDSLCEDSILKKLDEYKKYSSFALWDEGNISGQEWLKTIDQEFNPHYMFVGLNPSRANEHDWMSFHDGDNKSKDDVLYNALKETEYERAFLTDLFYDVLEPNSNNVLNKNATDVAAIRFGK